jgi:hypothetical protein
MQSPAKLNQIWFRSVDEEAPRPQDRSSVGVRAVATQSRVPRSNPSVQFVRSIDDVPIGVHVKHGCLDNQLILHNIPEIVEVSFHELRLHRLISRAATDLFFAVFDAWWPWHNQR